MAEINNNWVVPTVAPVSGVHDYATGFIQVGNELNKQYWQNRQAHLQNLTALSKYEATEYGQKMLNQIKDEINTKASVFEESGQWHKAGDFAYDIAQQLITDPRLPAITKDKAQYDAFKKSVLESEWDQASQNAILKEAKLGSSELVYNEADKTISGGFSPVNVGTPFDVEAFTKDISSILSKIKEDEISADRLADAQYAREIGLTTMTGLDGKAVASHLVKLTEETGGISKERVASVTQSLIEASPKYMAYLRDLARKNFINKYYDGETNSLKDVQAEDVISIIADPTKQFFNQLLKDKSYSIFDIISIDDKTNKAALKPKLTDDQKAFVDSFKTLTGNSLVDVFNGTAQLNPQLVKDTLTEYILDRYKAQSQDGRIDFNTWAEAHMSEAFVDENVTNLVNSMAGIHSNRKYKYSLDLTENKAYTEAIKAAYKNKGKGILGVGVTPGINALTTVRLSTGNHLDKIKAWNDLGADITKMTNANKEYKDVIINNYAKKYSTALGIDLSNEKNLKDIDLNALRKTLYGINGKGGLIHNSKSGITSDEADEIFATISAYVNNEQNIARNQAAINDMQYDYKRLRDIALKNSGEYITNPKSNTFLGAIGNKLAKESLGAILIKDNLLTYEDYKKAVETQVKKEIEEGKYLSSDVNRIIELRTISRDEYNSVLADAMTQIQTRYENINKKPFEYTTSNFESAHPHPLNQQFLDECMESAGRGTGGWYIAESSKGNAKSTAGLDLQPLMNIDIRNRSVTENSKGVSITTKNTIGKDLKPIDGKPYGIDGKIYYTETKMLLDPNLASQNKFGMVVNCFDANGTCIGKVILVKDVDRALNSKVFMNEYLNIQHGVTIGDVNAEQDLNNLASVATNSTYIFENINGGANPANIAQLQQMVDESETKSVTMRVHIPMFTRPDAPGLTRLMKFTKTASGYKVEDVDPNSSKKGYFNYTLGGYTYAGKQLDQYSGLQPHYYDDLTQALRALTKWNLEACAELITNAKINR